MSAEITIGFSTTNKWISKAIRYVMGGSPVSHAWVSFNGIPPWCPRKDVKPIRWIIEAESYGIEILPYDKWKRQGNILMADFALADSGYETLLPWLGSHVGIDYDFLAAFFAGASRALSGVTRWFHYWSNGNFLWSPDRMMCAEMVTRFLQKGKCPAVMDENPELFNPYQLLQRCLENPEQFYPIFLHSKISRLRKD